MTLAEAGLTCPECRGPVQLADWGHICPICGVPLAEALDLKAIDMTTGLIAADVVCVQCQYNLRTIPVGSVCPECGTPAVRSLTRDELRWANPEWVQTTAFALGMLAIAYAANLLGEIFSAAWSAAFGPVGSVPGWLISLGLGATWIVTTCLGGFGITRRERAEDPAFVTRRNRILRVGIVGVSVTCALLWMLPFARYAWDFGWTGLARASLRTVLLNSSRTATAVHVVLWIASLTFSLVTSLLLALRIRTLAVRAGKVAIRSAVTVGLGFWAINNVAHLGIMFFIWTITTSQLMTSYLGWYEVFSCSRQLSNIPYTIIFIVVCLRLRKRFRNTLYGRLRPTSN